LQTEAQRRRDNLKIAGNFVLADNWPEWMREVAERDVAHSRCVLYADVESSGISFSAAEYTEYEGLP